MRDDENRRGTDPMIEAILQGVKNLQEAMQQGFREAHARIDTVFNQVGKIEGLSAKVDGFVALMEKVEDRANHDMEDLKKGRFDHETRLRSLETAIIKPDELLGIKKDITELKADLQIRTGRNGVISKAVELGWKSWIAPVLVTASLTYLATKNLEQQAAPVTITAPATVIPGK